MARRKTVEQKIEGSLVPEIEQEEKRLTQLLDEVREQAENTVEEAERQAARIVAAAREAIPELLSRERRKRLSEIDTEIARLKAQSEEESTDLDEQASVRVDDAVSTLITHLFQTESNT